MMEHMCFLVRLLLILLCLLFCLVSLKVPFLDGINIVGLPIDNTGKRYIPLMPNDVLKVGALAN